YPAHAFLGEETGSQAGADGSEVEQPEFQWVIDPIDGTTNFIHGLPLYAISIALMQKGQITQAVVYDPSRNELFTASRGSGAFLNDRRIRVSGLRRYHEALLAAHLGKATNNGDPRFADMLAECTAVRRLGSTVLDLAYVAAGRIDGYCGVGLKPWDLAAGGLLVLEAGGLIGDFDGEQGWMESGRVIAATPKIFPQMLGYLQA